MVLSCADDTSVSFSLLGGRQREELLFTWTQFSRALIHVVYLFVINVCHDVMKSVLVCIWKITLCCFVFGKR